MDWADVARAEWISALALVLSGVSAIYTRRNYGISARKEVRELAATSPIAEIEPLDPRELSRAQVLPWLPFRITVRNRSAQGLRTVAISIRSLDRGFIVDAEKFDAYNIERPQQPPFYRTLTSLQGNSSPWRATVEPLSSTATTIWLKTFTEATPYELSIELEQPSTGKTLPAAVVRMTMAANPDAYVQSLHA